MIAWKSVFVTRLTLIDSLFLKMSAHAKNVSNLWAWGTVCPVLVNLMQTFSRHITKNSYNKYHDCCSCFGSKSGARNQIVDDYHPCTHWWIPKFADLWYKIFYFHNFINLCVIAAQIKLIRNINIFE